jgi:hypothetical protein
MKITRENEQGEVTRAWESRVFNLSDHLVCSECHHGWMNELENASRPLLAKLIRGSRHVFTLEDRETVTMWAVKTALTYRATQAKYKDTSIPTIPRAWLDLFYRGVPHPPKSVTVHLALNAGEERFHLIPHPFKLSGRHIVGGLDVDRITLVLDSLVMQVIIAFDFQGFYPAGLKAESWSRVGVHRIWPDTAPLVDAVSFPPAIAVSSQDISKWAHSEVNTASM